MNKYYLLVSLFLSSSVMVSAGPKQKKAETWIDASVKAKTELQAKLKKSGMPIVSTEQYEEFPQTYLLWQ